MTCPRSHGKKMAGPEGQDSNFKAQVLSTGLFHQQGASGTRARAPETACLGPPYMALEERPLPKEC